MSLAAIAALALGTVSCSNNASESATTDSTSTTDSSSTSMTTGTTSMATSNSYAAMADSVERNSAAGYYLNPKTGKPYGK